MPEVGVEPTLPEGNGILSYVCELEALADLLETPLFSAQFAGWGLVEFGRFGFRPLRSLLR